VSAEDTLRELATALRNTFDCYEDGEPEKDGPHVGDYRGCWACWAEHILAELSPPARKAKK